MHITCPHCQNPIEIVGDDQVELVCPSCGSSIQLDADRTRTFLPDSAARRIGKFELLEHLGTGAFGNVYKARDVELDRIVAIKIPRSARLSTQEDVARFLREARSTAQLRHPGIVSLFDAGQTDGTCFLVSEYVQGATLKDRLHIERFTFRRAADLIAEVADALQVAHQHGVVHRDIKPSNIMIDLDGRPHLMDFGLAKRDAGEITMTLDGQVLGTPAYMPPEQARGEGHEVDARGDVYSLGVILYEILTGELPFRGNSRMLIVQVLQDEPRQPRRINDKIPRDLETICLKCMAKEPNRRYQKACNLADDLRRFVAGEPIRARPMGNTERLWRWCRRNPMSLALLALLMLMLVIVLWHSFRLQQELVETSAKQSAALESDLLAELQSLYASEVVERVRAHGVEVSHDYRHKDNAIPLSETFTIQLTERVSKQGSGTLVRLYSDHPFPARRDRPALDAFELAALAALRERPEQPFTRWEDFLGRPVLRYATADIMRVQCVDCHNHHPESPKTDWKVGDVRGVLEVIQPLDSMIVAHSLAGLRGAYLLIGTLVIWIVGVFGIMLRMGVKSVR